MSALHTRRSVPSCLLMVTCALLSRETMHINELYDLELTSSKVSPTSLFVPASCPRVPQVEQQSKSASTTRPEVCNRCAAFTRFPHTAHMLGAHSCALAGRSHALHSPSSAYAAGDTCELIPTDRVRAHARLKTPPSLNQYWPRCLYRGG